MATGRAAITFNPATVSGLTKMFHGLGGTDNITNFRIIPEGKAPIRFGGCWLSNLQENLGFKAPGRTIKITGERKDPWHSHKMENFISYFKKIYDNER